MKNPAEIIEKLRLALDSNAQVRLALLFGSFAKDSVKPASDIDIAVAYERPLGMEDKIALSAELSR